MLYSRGRTHLRVFHSKDLISSEEQQTFQDQNSVEEHLKLLEYPKNWLIHMCTGLWWLVVQDVQNSLDNLRTNREIACFA